MSLHKHYNDEPMQSSILRITDAKTIELIELYEGEEILWNSNLKGYHNREKRAAAAQRIAHQLDIKHFKGRHVMAKFKNLRNTYNQELRKIARSKKAVANGQRGAVYQPRVHWFEKIDSFLRPHLQTSRPNSLLPENLDDTSRDEEKSDATTGAASDSEDAASDMVIIKTEKNIDEDPLQQVKEWPEVHSEEVTAQAVKREAFEDSEDEASIHARQVAPERCECLQQQQEAAAALHSAAERLGDIATRLSSQAAGPSRGDTFDSFGQYVAALLRSLPPAHAAALQPRMVALLTAPPTTADTQVSQSHQLV